MGALGRGCRASVNESLCERDAEHPWPGNISKLLEVDGVSVRRCGASG